MCTVISREGSPMYFGRNMDIECSFGESVVITPRGYKPASGRKMPFMRYSVIGMAAVSEDFPLYADAVNEKGLCMAGLYFPGNAVYADRGGKYEKSIATYELIPLILGSCENISQAKELLYGLTVTDEPFNERMPAAELHWIISDKTGSITVESTKAGLSVEDNPYGVLTNNPPFRFHCENVRQYIHLSPENPSNKNCGNFELSVFGQGIGAFGLPGDFSPASRFVKAFFCKTNSIWGDSEEDNVTQMFHILDTVAMPRGAVTTDSGKPDITTYSCCMSAQQGVYYFKTYENNRISMARLTDECMTAARLTVFPVAHTQSFYDVTGKTVNLK